MHATYSDRIMRVGELCSHEKLESIIPGDCGVPDLDHFRATLLEFLLEKKWLQCRVQCFTFFCKFTH